MLTINYLRTVKSGTLHVYAVNGTKSDLASYEETQGEYFRTDDKTGKPTYFSRKYLGTNAALQLSENQESGEVYYQVIKSEEYMIKEQIIKDSLRSPVTVNASKENANLED